jgi:hypothetical protein
MKFVDVTAMFRIVTMLAIFNLQNITKLLTVQVAVIVENLTVAHLFRTLSYHFHCAISRFCTCPQTNPVHTYRHYFFWITFEMILPPANVFPKPSVLVTVVTIEAYLCHQLHAKLYSTFLSRIIPYAKEIIDL